MAMEKNTIKKFFLKITLGLNSEVFTFQSARYILVFNKQLRDGELILSNSDFQERIF